VPNFTVPSPKKLEQMVVENYERTKVSAATKLSDIESLSIIVDEWKFEDRPESVRSTGAEDYIFQTLTCSATTKLYEQFTCFLGYKFDRVFSSREILETCKDLIPDFQSKVTNLFSDYLNYFQVNIFYY